MDGLDNELSGQDTTIEAGGGLSFDDLDQVETTRQEVIANKITEKKAAEKKVDDKEKGKEGDKAAPENSKSEKPGADKKADKEKEKEAKAAEKARAEVKRLKAKFGEEIFELPADATITHKVDGQDVEVSVQQALNDYSGKVSWDKKFSEIDRDKKAFMAEKQNHQARVAEFKRLVSDDKLDPMEAIKFVLDQAGVRKDTYFKRIKESLMPDIESYLNMDEHEREAFNAQEENKFLRDELESVNQSKARQQTEKELHNQLTVIRETHKLQDEEMVEAYNFAEKNGATEELASLEKIAQIAVNLRDYRKAATILHGFNPQLFTGVNVFDGISNKEVLDDVFDIIQAHPDFDDSELNQVIAEIYGTPKDVETVKRKITDENRKTPKGVETKESSDYVSFDDLKD